MYWILVKALKPDWAPRDQSLFFFNLYSVSLPQFFFFFLKRWLIISQQAACHTIYPGIPAAFCQKEGKE